MRQLQALALSRSGASRLANPILQQLVREGHRDEETAGMLARTHKDLWAEASDPDERRVHLELAFRQYADAFDATLGYWTGINAATMALLLGNVAVAKTIARAVREQCLALHKKDASADAYWIAATLGEAALLLESWSEAEDWYGKAAAHGRGKLGDIVSTRRNARLILSHLNVDTARVDACFTVPPVVVFAGHLIDRPGRAAARFPASSEPAVRDAIRRSMATLAPAIGYASAACGGDILFSKRCSTRPRRRTSFCRTTAISFAARASIWERAATSEYWSGWNDRYARVLERAAEVVTASEQRMGTGSTSYEYGFRWLDGAAAVKADELETELITVALWDGIDGDGPGGTSWAV